MVSYLNTVYFDCESLKHNHGMYIIALHSANSIKGCGHLVRTSLSRPLLSQMKFKRGSFGKFVSQLIMAVIAEYLFWKSSDSLKSTNEKEIRVENSHQTS